MTINEKNKNIHQTTLNNSCKW